MQLDNNNAIAYIFLQIFHFYEYNTHSSINFNTLINIQQTDQLKPLLEES